MHKIFKLCLVACMWLGLVSGSFPLTMDIKLICDDQAIGCVCNHGAKPCSADYFNIALDVVRTEYLDKSLEFLVTLALDSIVQQFQRAGKLSSTAKFSCSSLQLIRKDSEPDVEDRCMMLWETSIENILDELKSMQDLAIELKLQSLCDESHPA